MIVDISIAVIAGFFALLVIFLIIMFLSVTKAVQRIEKHIESLNSLFRSVSNVGDALEVATEDLKAKMVNRVACENKVNCEDIDDNVLYRKPDLTDRVAEGLTLAALAISLWTKIKKRS